MNQNILIIKTLANTDNMGKLFVMVFAPPRRDFVASLLNFCSCTQDKFVMVVAPGHAHLPAIKILHLDKLLSS